MKRRILILLVTGLLILSFPISCSNGQKTAEQKAKQKIEEQREKEEAERQTAEQKIKDEERRKKEEAERQAAEQKRIEGMCQTVNVAVGNNPANLSIQDVDAINELLDRNNPTAQQPGVVDSLVKSGANCLDENASWTDTERGRKIYDTLKRYDGNLVSDILVQNVLSYEKRLQVLFLVVKLGIEGSEAKLSAAFMQHGNKSMAEDFINCGSSGLYDVGKKWADENGYYIMTGPGSNRVTWGSF